MAFDEQQGFVGDHDEARKFGLGRRTGSAGRPPRDEVQRFVVITNLLKDGPTLKREELRILALALSLRGVLKQTWEALKEMVSPQALVAMIVWTAGLYLTLWLLPEPASKLLAVGMTLLTPPFAD